jgi:hypothetical protein
MYRKSMHLLQHHLSNDSQNSSSYLVINTSNTSDSHHEAERQMWPTSTKRSPTPDIIPQKEISDARIKLHKLQLKVYQQYTTGSINELL